MNTRGNVLLPRLLPFLLILAGATSAFAGDQRFFPIASGTSGNFLVLRPGDRGNTAGQGAASSGYKIAAPQESISIQRYQPSGRRSYVLSTGPKSFPLPKTGFFAAPTAQSAGDAPKSDAPYSAGFYGAAYAGGTEQSWPVDPAAYKGMSSGFGWRKHPTTGRGAFHKGVDLAAPSGAPVLASADGIVEETGREALLGNYVRLRHTDGSQSLYGHLSAIHVKKGDWLNRQQRLGAVGSTGRSTGPHLHYALNVNDQAVNPMPYLTPPSQFLASR